MYISHIHVYGYGKAVTKVVDTLTQEHFYGACQKVLER